MAGKLSVICCFLDTEENQQKARFVVEEMDGKADKIFIFLRRLGISRNEEVDIALKFLGGMIYVLLIYTQHINIKIMLPK